MQKNQWMELVSMTCKILKYFTQYNGQFDKFFRRKIVIIYRSISLNMCFGAQKNLLIETVLLSTHNICFGWEIQK